MNKKQIQKLATRIKAHRRQLGVNLRDAAAATKLSAATLCRLEQGKLDAPTLGTMVRVAKWLKVPLAQIAPGVE